MATEIAKMRGGAKAVQTTPRTDAITSEPPRAVFAFSGVVGVTAVSPIWMARDAVTFTKLRIAAVTTSSPSLTVNVRYWTLGFSSSGDIGTFTLPAGDFFVSEDVSINVLAGGGLSLVVSNVGVFANVSVFLDVGVGAE